MFSSRGASRFVCLFMTLWSCATVVGAFNPSSSTANPARHHPSSTSWSRRKVATTWGVTASLHREPAVVAMAPPPATLLETDKPLRTGSTGPAVLERPETLPRERRVEDPRKERKGMGSEAWEVRIYNDGMNTREHVARSLVQVTGMSEMDAYQTMMQAHVNGIAVVGRYLYEVAEMFHDALKKNGIVCDIVPVDEDL